MADLRTVLDRMMRETNRTSPNDRFLCARGLEAALRKYRNRDLQFNRAFGGLTAGADAGVITRESGWTRTDLTQYPRDLLKMGTMRASSDKNIIAPVPLEDIYGYDNLAKPCVRAWRGKDLLIRGVPGEGIEFEFDYIKNLGELMVRTQEDGTRVYMVNGEIVDENYTNEWFVEGQDLLANAAAVILFLGPFKDSEKANLHGTLRDEALRDVEGLQDMEGSIPPPTPWFGP